jgi:pantoate--beta-alanine ligase
MQRLAREWRRAGVPVGLVPTMGYLHDGHLSLVARARRAVGPQGRLVLSLYVNPTQFGPQEDLAHYPRDPRRDRALCREAGVDVLFLPTDAAMYPGRERGDYSTYVVEEVLSQGMEGGARPTHFRGVTTIVAKLFNLVLPDAAVFGAKDFQQLAVIRRMTRDLNFPVKVISARTVREPDGLAMSSRNAYLSAEERAQALVLREAGLTAREIVREAGPTGVPAVRLKRRVAACIRRKPAAQLDYVEFFDPATLRPRRTVDRSTHMALAVRVGRTRLIDNLGMSED